LIRVRGGNPVSRKGRSEPVDDDPAFLSETKKGHEKYPGGKKGERGGNLS